MSTLTLAKANQIIDQTSETKFPVGAPVIREPQPGAIVPPGRLRLRAEPAAGTAATTVFVEFRWSDTPAGSLPHVRFWTGPMDALISGFYVSESITNRLGRWQVRARITAPKDGPWSAEVPFTLSLTRPHSSSRP